MITEVLPLLDLYLGQHVVHEDQDGEPTPELFRVDVNKLGPSPGLSYTPTMEKSTKVSNIGMLLPSSLLRSGGRRVEEEEASENIFW